MASVVQNKIEKAPTFENFPFQREIVGRKKKTFTPMSPKDTIMFL